MLEKWIDGKGRRRVDRWRGKGKGVRGEGIGGEVSGKEMREEKKKEWDVGGSYM